MTRIDAVNLLGLRSASSADANGSNLSSALGSPLAQLLQRPEIVIEDFAGVVRESYPEYFAAIDHGAGEAQAADLASANGSGADPSPRRVDIADTRSLSRRLRFGIASR